MACLDTLIWYSRLTTFKFRYADSNRPGAREYLCHFPADFALAIMESISVSWPFSDDEVFCRNDRNQIIRLNPEFYLWCMDINNWSLDKSALKLMPELEGMVRIRQM